MSEMNLPTAITDEILSLARETVFRCRVFDCTMKDQRMIGKLSVKGSSFDTVLELKILLLNSQ